MEANNRGVWLIVVVIVILACCSLLACSAVGVGLLAWPSLNRFSEQSPGDAEGGLHTQRINERFDVGISPTLRIDSLAGGITVRGDEVEAIQVVATKKAQHRSDLDRIEVSMAERDGSLEIKTGYPSRSDNVSVSFEITVPAATHLEVNLVAGAVVVEGLTGGLRIGNAAGAVVLKDVSGGIDARTAAGVVTAHGAAGPVSLESAAGIIDYQGTPQGDCHFGASAGSISLELPANPDVAVDLQATIGAVDAACDVEGKATGRRVSGIIGTGAQGTVTARATVGDIDMVCR